MSHILTQRAYYSYYVYNPQNQKITYSPILLLCRNAAVEIIMRIAKPYDPRPLRINHNVRTWPLGTSLAHLLQALLVHEKFLVGLFKLLVKLFNLCLILSLDFCSQLSPELVLKDLFSPLHLRRQLLF